MTPPTHLELMAFVDGELPEDRALAVAEWLASHPEDEELIQQLDQLALLTRDAAAERAPDEAAYAVADDVMSAIARLDAAERYAASVPPEPRVTSRPVQLVRSKDPPPREGALIPTRAGAVALVTVLAAAAAALVWWQGQAPGREAAGPVASLATAPGPGPMALTGQEPEPREHRPDSAITAVDFGAHAGSIFYVAGQADSSSTTVVWLAEEP